MTSDDRTHYALALSVLTGETLKNAWNMIDKHGPKIIFEYCAKEKDCKAQDYIAKIYNDDPRITAEGIIKTCGKKSIDIIDYWDPRYPALLKEISRPPLVLYCMGSLPKNKMIAVVGTRKSDPRSERTAKKISGELIDRGYSVVSGMAIGIDRAAHLGALEKNGPTIGILANGIDVTYPAFNRDLYKMIESSPVSALLSEYPPEIFAGKWTFIRRNRIISGISLGTVVVKAGMKSGALITARYASEQNREVFACPGHSFDDEYSGCNNLIKNGAVLVSSIEDIINELPGQSGELFGKSHSPAGLRGIIESGEPRPISEFDDPLMEKILNILTFNEIEIDSIIRLIGCPPGEANRAIMMLEISGFISRNGNFISKP